MKVDVKDCIEQASKVKSDMQKLIADIEDVITFEAFGLMSKSEVGALRVADGMVSKALTDLSTGMLYLENALKQGDN